VPASSRLLIYFCYEADSVPNPPQQMARESSYFLDQVGSIDSLNLRDIGYACLWQVSVTSSYANIARKRGVSEVRSNGDDYNCIQTTLVKSVVL
jgi:hypothetical protein